MSAADQKHRGLKQPAATVGRWREPRVHRCFLATAAACNCAFHPWCLPFLDCHRAKLEAEGWHVAPTVSTVPIPGVNMPKNADYRTWQG